MSLMLGNQTPRPYIVTMRCDGAERKFRVQAYEVLEALMQANLLATGSGVKTIDVVSVEPDSEAIIDRAQTERDARAADVRAIVNSIVRGSSRKP